MICEKQALTVWQGLPACDPSRSAKPSKPSQWTFIRESARRRRTRKRQAHGGEGEGVRVGVRDSCLRRGETVFIQQRKEINSAHLRFEPKGLDGVWGVTSSATSSSRTTFRAERRPLFGDGDTTSPSSTRASTVPKERLGAG